MSAKRPEIVYKDLPKVTQDLIDKRRRLLGPNVPTFYEDPVHLVRAKGVHVWDADGRKYLDCYNNVAHVGHCHPDVVAAIYEQANTLNTHTRYLHDGILDYVTDLTATFDGNLDSAIMTCTGSEANDIALRIAQAITGKTGVIATDHTYHGNTMAVSQLSRVMPPPGGFWDNVDHVPAPDSYRPIGGPSQQEQAASFITHLKSKIERLEQSGHGFSALIICPFFANEGFPDLGPDWFKPVVAAVHAAGGVLIADEVQPGFGRLGSHMWGHQRAGFAPDIVTLGKPIANGHPVGAVITSQDNLAEFRTHFKYFNTFGGNPVSCAAAHATLRVVQNEDLMQNAQIVGAYAIERLKDMAKRHEVIGDVRGAGLFFGAELVKDHNTREPATEFATKVSNEMRKRGILLSTLGIHYNTLKCRPPLPFTMDDTDVLMETLESVLTDLRGP
jgi:4-aminobutyrate aminotransferase-like enzyme